MDLDYTKFKSMAQEAFFLRSNDVLVDHDISDADRTRQPIRKIQVRAEHFYM